MTRYLIILLMILLPGKAFASDAEDVMKKSQAAFLYPGKDFKARVTMTLINKGGQQRVRELTMLRKNYGDVGGDQKYFIYFFQPVDVKDMAFMVYKYPAKDDDRWLFVPAVSMVRKIAAQDKRSSFVGSDFTYEDVSGRDVEDDRHIMVKEEKFDGKDCYVIKSTPKAQDVDYDYKLSWIDKVNFLPLKEEFYDKQNELYRQFEAAEIKDINGFPTVTRRVMRNVKAGHRSEVTYAQVEYNSGMPDDIFSERTLRRPPAEWIK